MNTNTSYIYMLHSFGVNWTFKQAQGSTIRLLETKINFFVSENHDKKR